MKLIDLLSNISFFSFSQLFQQVPSRRIFPRYFRPVPNRYIVQRLMDILPIVKIVANFMHVTMDEHLQCHVHLVWHTMN